jgi:hypothetical protein
MDLRTADLKSLNLFRHGFVRDLSADHLGVEELLFGRIHFDMTRGPKLLDKKQIL